MKEQSTSYITNHALKILPLMGFEVWRQNNIRVPGRKFIGKKGLADIIGFRKKDGKFIAVEVKGPGDKLSKDQQEFLNKLEKAGGIVIVAKNTIQFEQDLKEQAA